MNSQEFGEMLELFIKLFIKKSYDNDEIIKFFEKYGNYECINMSIDDFYNGEMDEKIDEMLIRIIDVIGEIEKDITTKMVIKLGLLNHRITELIKKTGEVDKYLTPEMIKKLKKIGLEKYNIINLIEATGKIEQYLTPEMIKELVLLNYEITNLIKKTGKIEQYLLEGQTKDDKNLTFSIVNVIKATGKIEQYLTPEMVFKFYLDSDRITELVKETKKIDKYLLKWQKKDDKDLTFDITNLIKATGKVEEYLTTEKIKELELSNYEITKLIKETGKIEKYLTLERIKEFNLDNGNIIHLIKATGKIEEYLTPEKIKELGLKEVNVIILRENITNIEENSKKINLPSDMTIGVEIESEGKNSEDIVGCRFIEGWKCERDESLNEGEGVEIASPILTGNTEETSNSIKKICHILKKCKQTGSENCGGHIHIGANYLTTNESWSNLIEIWGNTEEIFYTISNKEGEIPRNGIVKYASPISSNFEKLLNEETIQLNRVEDIQVYAKKAQEYSRYYGINFFNIGHQKNTIEFRLPNGTIDASIWIENINLFGGLVVASERLTQIKENVEEERTDEENEMLQCFAKIKDAEITEKEKAKALIELIIPESERDIYFRRYEKNSELIKKSPELKETFEDKTTKKTFLLKKDVGKKIFTEDNPVNGVDYIDNEKIIMKDLQKEKANLEYM